MRHPQRSLATSILMVTALLTSLVAAIAQGPTPAEENFWETIKNSTTAAEFRAYLEAFPKGFYADRARQRISELEGRRPDNIVSPQPRPETPRQGPSTDIPFTPPSTQPPASNPPANQNPGPSVLTSYEVVREVQERLYALNYNIKVVNGQLSKETRDAIKSWQQVVRRPATGDMNAEELAYLRSATPISNWGAIAFEARGAYGMVWNSTSRQDAENDAMTECRKRAAANANNCQVFTLGDSQCGAMSWYQGTANGRTHWGAFVVRRPTFGEAQTDVLEECRRQAKAPRGCQVRVTFCADGSHKR